MNNYNKIKNMTLSEMAKFLNEFDRTGVVDVYCTECMKNNNYCEDFDDCPIDKEKMFLEWLDKECN